MAWIDPPTPYNSEQMEEVEEDEPYVVTLKAVEIDYQAPYGNPEGEPEPRLVADWEFANGLTVRDWIALRLGGMKGGGVSKLRQLLNAAADKAPETPVRFNPKTMEWTYDFGSEAAPYSKLFVGMEITIRGVRKAKADGSTQYRIEKYRPVRKEPAKAAATAKASQALKGKLVEVDPEEIPF